MIAMNSEQFKIFDAICEAYDDPALKPKLDDPATEKNERETYCNRAVDKIAKAMGYVLFSGLNANKMVEKMQKSPDWSQIGIERAQFLANQGSLVVAGQIELPHGHVAVVRPGLEAFSGKWNKLVPRVCNIGATNFIGHHIGHAFRNEPIFYVWNGTSTFAPPEA